MSNHAQTRNQARRPPSPRVRKPPKQSKKKIRRTIACMVPTQVVLSANEQCPGSFFWDFANTDEQKAEPPPRPKKEAANGVLSASRSTHLLTKKGFGRDGLSKFKDFAAVMKNRMGFLLDLTLLTWFFVWPLRLVIARKLKRKEATHKRIITSVQLVFRIQNLSVHLMCLSGLPPVGSRKALTTRALTEGPSRHQPPSFALHCQKKNSNGNCLLDHPSSLIWLAPERVASREKE